MISSYDYDGESFGDAWCVLERKFGQFRYMKCWWNLFNSGFIFSEQYYRISRVEKYLVTFVRLLILGGRTIWFVHVSVFVQIRLVWSFCLECIIDSKMDILSFSVRGYRKVRPFGVIITCGSVIGVGCVNQFEQ